MSTPNDLFLKLQDLGFRTKLRYKIVPPGANFGTTKQSTVAEYVAALTLNGHIVVLSGAVYTVGEEPFVSARLLSTVGCRTALQGVPPTISNLEPDHLVLLRGACDAIKLLSPQEVLA